MGQLYMLYRSIVSCTCLPGMVHLTLASFSRFIGLCLVILVNVKFMYIVTVVIKLSFILRTINIISMISIEGETFQRVHSCCVLVYFSETISNVSTIFVVWKHCKLYMSAWHGESDHDLIFMLHWALFSYLD